jgi:hypothetical protein
MDAREMAKQRVIERILEKWKINSLDEILPGYLKSNILGQSAIGHLRTISNRCDVSAARKHLREECGRGPVTFTVLQRVSQKLSKLPEMKEAKSASKGRPPSSSANKTPESGTPRTGTKLPKEGMSVSKDKRHKVMSAEIPTVSEADAPSIAFD